MKGNCNYSKKNGNDRRKMTEKYLLRKREAFLQSEWLPDP